MKISCKPPSGMRDFDPQTLLKRKRLIATIEYIYQQHGFVPIETPSIENLSALMGKYGEEGDKLVFKILHRGEKLKNIITKDNLSETDLADTALRYDLTVPFARFVANSPELPKYFKRYQIQPVWRADRPGKGRYREFMQADVDIIGTTSIIAEAEVCSAIANVFKALGLNDYTIHVNHRLLLESIIAYAKIDEAHKSSAFTAIDKYDKIGKDGVCRELEQRGFTKKQIQLLSNYIFSECDKKELLEVLNKDFSESDAAKMALSQLEELFSLLQPTPAGDNVVFDPSLARGLGYYTGLIFEVRSKYVSGSIGGGGRYDGLIGMFKGSCIPAVGFSIGFERLVLLMEEQNLFDDVTSSADALICHFPEVNKQHVFRLASFLRDKKIKTEIFPDDAKLKKQLSYAQTSNIKFALIIGETEAEKNLVSLKDLRTKTQLTLSFQEAADKIIESS